MVTGSLVCDNPATATSVYRGPNQPNKADRGTLSTNATFELDGEHVGTYSHIPDPDADQFEYNITILGSSGVQRHKARINRWECARPQAFALVVRLREVYVRVLGPHFRRVA